MLTKSYCLSVSKSIEFVGKQENLTISALSNKELQRGLATGVTRLTSMHNNSNLRGNVSLRLWGHCVCMGDLLRAEEKI